MSDDIKRYSCGDYLTPAVNGSWVSYDDHQAAIAVNDRKWREKLEGLRDGLGELIDRTDRIRNKTYTKETYDALALCLTDARMLRGIKEQQNEQ